MTDLTSLLGWGRRQASPLGALRPQVAPSVPPTGPVAAEPAVGKALPLSYLLHGKMPSAPPAATPTVLASPAPTLARGRAPQRALEGAPRPKRERSHPPCSGGDGTPAGDAGGSPPADTAGRYGSSSRRTVAGALDPALKRRALDLFYKTQGLARLLRDPKTALKQTELRPLFEGMSPDEMAQAVMALTRDMGMNKARRSALTQLDKFYEAKGLAAVYPIKLLGVLAYAANYVVGKGNLSHVLSTAMSNLRRAAIHEGQWDLDEDDEAQLTDAIKALKRALPSEAKESEAVDIDRLLVLLHALALKDDAQSARMGAIIAAAVNLKMRGTEVFGPKGLRREDVREESGGIVYNGRLVKIGEETLAARPRAAPHLPVEYELLCLSYWLQRYLAAADPMGTMPAKNFLFCPLDAAGRWTSAQPKDTVENAAIFELMRSEGVRTEGLNVEWGRHTGHSLHVLRCGLEQPTSDLLGDHANAASTGKKHYLHTTSQGSYILMLGAEKVTSHCRGKICCQ